ncbi:unnamed protein product [Gongylonema pulchrum]|uniref:F-box domain-containing protein n=1 Tax=Gongylonema pulchrum TaxID=637853 RepID=A0A183DB47_9BILA|nr:unnamed protein product [Gongylonema pulchrum]
MEEAQRVDEPASGPDDFAGVSAASDKSRRRRGKRKYPEIRNSSAEEELNTCSSSTAFERMEGKRLLSPFCDLPNELIIMIW